MFQKRRATRLLMIKVSHPVYGEEFTPDEADRLIAEGANVNLLMPELMSPLAHISVWGNVGVARVLLRRGADPNGNAHRESIPLHIAAMNGHVELVKVLVESGADINATDKRGSTALHKAVLPDSARKAGAPEALVELGADPRVRDRAGKTPLAELSELVHTLVGGPPLGIQSQQEKDERDRALTDDLRRLTLLLGG